MKTYTFAEYYHPKKYHISEKIYDTFKQKYKEYIKYMYLLGVCLIIINHTHVSAKESTVAIAELDMVSNFIHFIINIIRGICISVTALLSANTGLKMLLEDRGDVMMEAKKLSQKILWSLFLTFGGTTLAEFISRRIMNGL